MRDRREVASIDVGQLRQVVADEPHPRHHVDVEREQDDSVTGDSQHFGKTAVDDLDDVLARLRARGAELVGEVERYRDSYRLCYVRGPEGIIVELAEAIG